MEKSHTIAIEKLTRENFAAFGDVVETESAPFISINQGFADRYNDLAGVDVAIRDGTACVAIFEGRVLPSPIEIRLMERHPFGSQLFFPLQDEPWLVLVCDAPDVPGSYRAFQATGRQGVNYRRNTWHHPLLVLRDGSRFLVVDRAGPENNLEEILLGEATRIQIVI